MRKFLGLLIALSFFAAEALAGPPDDAPAWQVQERPRDRAGYPDADPGTGGPRTRTQTQSERQSDDGATPVPRAFGEQAQTCNQQQSCDGSPPEDAVQTQTQMRTREQQQAFAEAQAQLRAQYRELVEARWQAHLENKEQARNQFQGGSSL